MEKITIKDLERLVSMCNAQSGYEDGKNKDKFILDGAYGGYKFALLLENGGQKDITSGYITKKELYYQIKMFLSGMGYESYIRTRKAV